MKLKLFSLFLLIPFTITATDQPKKGLIRRMSDNLTKAETADVIATLFIFGFPIFLGKSVIDNQSTKINQIITKTISSNPDPTSIEYRLTKLKTEVETLNSEIKKFKTIDATIKSLGKTIGINLLIASVIGLTAKYLNKLARKYMNIKDETPTDIEEEQLV